jgi:hypothetical protein
MKLHPIKILQNYDRLWKLRTASDNLNIRLSEVYQPPEHLSIDEIIVLFNGKVVYP